MLGFPRLLYLIPKSQFNPKIDVKLALNCLGWVGNNGTLRTKQDFDDWYKGSFFEVRMANDWQYICTKCGHQVTSGVDFRGTCPNGHSSWMCNWRDGGFKAEKVGDKASDPMVRHPDNLSQVFVSSGSGDRDNNKRGPKPLRLDDVVRELASQGLSSRAIGRETQ